MRRAVVHLMERWQLSPEEAAVLLEDETDARLAALLGVHRALKLIFVDRAQGYAWTRQPNTAFDGQSALDVMLGGGVTGIVRVLRYLQAEVAG